MSDSPTCDGCGSAPCICEKLKAALERSAELTDAIAAWRGLTEIQRETFCAQVHREMLDCSNVALRLLKAAR